MRAILIGLVLGLALALAVPERSLAGALPRIASMNVCTDSLLLAFADPDQIVGLSRYSRDDRHGGAQTGGFAVLSGGAEDILTLQPDVVVTTPFNDAGTGRLLRRQGLRVEEFAVPRDVSEVKAQIIRMAALTGHSERSAAVLARLDSALSRARQVFANRRERVLAFSRRGWVDGRESPIGVMLAAAGLRNAADELGISTGALVSLEAVIVLKPDLLLIQGEGEPAEDEGSALLSHPALERFYPAARRILIPERLASCGGIMLIDAIDALIAGMPPLRVSVGSRN